MTVYAFFLLNNYKYFFIRSKKIYLHVRKHRGSPKGYLVDIKEKLIERERLITLSYKDAQVFFDALENPPEPNDKLKNAVKEYKNSGLYEQTENRTA